MAKTEDQKPFLEIYLGIFKQVSLSFFQHFNRVNLRTIRHPDEKTGSEECATLLTRKPVQGRHFPVEN